MMAYHPQRLYKNRQGLEQMEAATSQILSNFLSVLRGSKDCKQNVIEKE